MVLACLGAGGRGAGLPECWLTGVLTNWYGVLDGWSGDWLTGVLASLGAGLLGSWLAGVLAAVSACEL